MGALHGRSLYEAFLALEEMSVRAWGAVPTVHGQRGGRAAWRGNAGPATPCMCIHTYRPHTLKGRGKGQLHSTRTLLLWKGGQGTLQWAPPMGNTHFLFPWLMYRGPSSSSTPSHCPRLSPRLHLAPLWTGAGLTPLCSPHSSHGYLLIISF